jgi:mono/diheme cytochrome c family protein
MTEDLHKIRDSVQRGGSRILKTKGVSFGRIARRVDGTWDVSQVTGLPRFSIITATPLDPPSLVIRPWHQSSNVVSLREFSNNAMNQHHGIQSTERFGVGDADGDGISNEMTRADMTALAIYQAVMAVPGQVIPSSPRIEGAITRGREVFTASGCSGCHIPELPLYKKNWNYTEPNPYNPPTNLREGETQTLSVDLTDPRLPQPRLAPASPMDDYIMIPVFSDFKLHDITDAGESINSDPLDMNQSVWSPKFKQGNRKFLTKRLWGAANEPPYFHHGLFTTLREAIVAHSGEALESRKAFEELIKDDKDSLIEFLKSLQVLPPGTKELVVDENGKAK